MEKFTYNLQGYLKSLSSEQLRNEIKELNQLFVAVQEHYLSKLNDLGEGELLKKYKKLIKDEFFPDSGHGKLRLSVARKAISDFKKLSRNHNNMADIMLYYVEMGADFTNEYGDIDENFYESIERMYQKAAEYIIEHKAEAVFCDRMKKIVDDTENVGWGFHDTLGDIYYGVFLQKDYAA